MNHLISNSKFDSVFMREKTEEEREKEIQIVKMDFCSP